MKGYLYLAAIYCLFPLLASAQSDVYYIPSKKAKTVTKINSNGGDTETYYSANAVANETKTAKYYSENRDVDEYNRRGSSATSSAADEPVYSDDETAVNNPQAIEDYNCTKHIIRFYSPRRGVIISSPYYWDICYNDVWDVYYDSWAYGLPSYAYWTYAYDPWYYNHWWYRSCWDFTWGWYDPWWGSYYWGWRHPLYWGWDRPYYGGWAFHHGPHHYHFNAGWGHSFGHRQHHMMADNNGFRMGRPGSSPANARVMQGGRNYRSLNNNINTNHGSLSKSFRSGSFASNAQANTSRTRSTSTVTQGAGYTRNIGGGGFSRNATTSSTNSRSRNYTTNANGNRVYSTQGTSRSIGNSSSNSNRSTYSRSTESNSRSYTPTTTAPSRSVSSYGNSGSSSSSSRSGGSFGGGGFSRGGSSSGGGGFSRGGGGGRR